MSMTAIISLVAPVFGFYQWWQKTHGKIKIKTESVMDRINLTFVNNGQSRVLLGAGSTSGMKYGFITPKGKSVPLEDSGVGQEYPYSLGIHEYIERSVFLGLINQHLVNERSVGIVPIRFFIRDEAGKVYISPKQPFRAQERKLSIAR